MSKDDKQHAAQTTGHAWDGDLQEFNNPLPRWWVWAFYITVIFSIGYWVLYPAWPIGKTYTKGVLNTVEYTTAEGERVQTHWNTRALYQQEMEQARVQQAKMLQGLEQASYQDILNDHSKRGLIQSMAKVLYADNCQACHQAGGAGIVGQYPNLADDDWLWGGQFAQIETSIREGRKGVMPSFKSRFTTQQIQDIAEYVIGLSDTRVDKDSAARGALLFQGPAGCVACHGQTASGNTALGAANLTDSIWSVAPINPVDSLKHKRQAVITVIENGIQRTMPAWKERLTPTEIKMLTLYLHSFGGGQEVR